MATNQLDRPLVPNIDRLLAQLRSRVRLYVWMHGLALIVAAFGVAFWAALFIDWTFEPSRPIRVVMLGIIGFAVAYVAYRWLLSRAFVPLTDRNMAVVVERRYRQFDDALLTTVELTDAASAMPGNTREMLAHTRDAADRRAKEVNLGEMFNPRPLWTSIFSAVGLTASIVVLAILAPGFFNFFLSRLTTKTDELYPRYARLEIEGFKNGEVVIARGANVRIVVNADTDMIVPKLVQIRYRTEEGDSDRRNMIREGSAGPEDRFQPFSYEFQSVLSSIEFDVIGEVPGLSKDVRLRKLKIRVVDSPTISKELDAEYPPYTGLAPRTGLALNDAVSLPRGTRVTVHATANKDLVKVKVDGTTANSVLFSQDVPLAKDAKDARHFDFTLDTLSQDITLVFTLLDTDGIQNREPVRLRLTATADNAPEVNVHLDGIGSAITPQARLPLAGEISDDYGLSKAWLHFTVDEAPAAEQPLTVQPNGRVAQVVDEAVEVEQLRVLMEKQKVKLAPGQKLLVAVQAIDTHSLPGLEPPNEPNTGSGERFMLDIVTPEQLLAMLEMRELNLRQTFERIIEEMTDSRNLLTSIEVEGSAKEPAADEAPEAAATPEAAAEAKKRRRERNLGVILRAVQNSQKNATEIEGVAESFDTIRAELINNRIDTEEMRIRLKDRIADPLHDVVAKMFPQYDLSLSSMNGKLDDDAATLSKAKQAAVAQADAILVELEKIRGRMLELETFNEALALLRAIIDSQDQIRLDTEKARDEKVKKLLGP